MDKEDNEITGVIFLISCQPRVGEIMFETISNLYTFWIKVKAEYTEIATKALKSLLPFPTSHLYEAGLSAVTATKTRSWSRLDISNTLSGVSVSHHPQIGQSSCRKTSSGFPLILHYGGLYNYFIIYHNMIIEIKCIVNVMCLNHPETIPHSACEKNCLPQNWCQKDWALLFQRLNNIPLCTGIPWRYCRCGSRPQK